MMKLLNNYFLLTRSVTTFSVNFTAMPVFYHKKETQLSYEQRLRPKNYIVLQ